MKTITFVVLVFIASMTSISQATVIQIEGDTATNIYGLEFDGNYYDVAFLKSNYSTLLNQGVDFIFLDNQTGADSFVDAINSVLPDTFVFFGNSIVQCKISPSCKSTGYFIPFKERLPVFYDAAEGYYKHNDGPAYSISPGLIAVFAIVNQAIPPTIPEPATLALMGLGLAGIGYQRRRRSKKAV